MKINELRPFQKKVDLPLKVVKVNEAREVSSKLDNSTHKVTEAVVGDDTGTVLLTLWDEAIEQVKENQVYNLENGYTSLFKNSLRLNVGRYGKLTESEDDIKVNEENNLSDKEFERPQRSFTPRDGGGGYRGGGGRSGGGGFRGGGGGRGNFRGGGGGRDRDNRGRGRDNRGGGHNDNFESDNFDNEE
ncbi:MAG: single-stranded DNA-binding protein [archaeon]|nr:single-stranded DNA-binding protein [archaeon]